jgi:hypothetical protein
MQRIVNSTREATLLFPGFLLLPFLLPIFNDTFR